MDNNKSIIISNSCAELDSVPLFQYFTDNGKKPIEMKSIDTNKYINDQCFDNGQSGTSFFDLIENPVNRRSLLFEFSDKDEQIIDEDKEEYKWIDNEIDLIYDRGGFREGQLHASLSRHKYYYAGEAIYNFFTDDSINRIIIGNSSGDMRNHTIFKCRKRKMVFEVHFGHGHCDIFPLYGILDYLEDYNPDIAVREDFIKLSNNLPNYNMVPLSKD